MICLGAPMSPKSTMCVMLLSAGCRRVDGLRFMRFGGFNCTADIARSKPQLKETLKLATNKKKTTGLYWFIFETAAFRGCCLCGIGPAATFASPAVQQSSSPVCMGDMKKSSSRSVKNLPGQIHTPRSPSTKYPVLPPQKIRELCGDALQDTQCLDSSKDFWHEKPHRE